MPQYEWLRGPFRPPRRPKRALKVSEGSDYAVVWLDGYDFTDGVIEVDILGRGQPQGGSFVGVAFRVIDAKTLGVWVGEGSAGHFANLRVTRAASKPAPR